MANIKISALPAVTTLSNSDIFPSVAGSTTSKITLKNLANTLPEVTSSISASFARTAVTSSYPIAVSGSTLYSTAPKSIIPAGNSLIGSVFLGQNAGLDVTSARYSNFIGLGAGTYAYAVESSNFIGQGAGYNCNGASFSNFIGRSTGENQFNASYTVLLGYKTGIGDGVTYIGSNNIIIGTNISLAEGTNNAINLGGLIFGSGSYSNPAGNPLIGTTNGKVGINQPNPEYSLDVSGSFRVEDGFTILTKVSESLNFIDDAAAQAGGVPLGGLYRNGNLIYIRLL